MECMFSKVEKNYGGFMDIAEYNGYLYAIQNSGQYNGGRLCVLDNNLKILGVYEGIGDARQIKIANGIAVISARANGIVIFDVKTTQPKKLSQYQTIELATGITIYSNLVFVSCRQYGVEIVDINEPQKPTYKGIIRVGEVQATCVHENVLYCGLWGDMKVAAVNIKDIKHPEIIYEYELNGRGDGVVVHDNFLYAVSGQHGKNIKNYQDENDPEFGNGNGISIFDITKNKEVFFDNFGKGYFIHIDTWKPILCGDLLVCCDSILGVHIYNAKNFKKIAEINEFDGDAVTSVVSSDNSLYIATAYGGIYKYDKLYFDKTYSYTFDKKIISEKNKFEMAEDNKLKLSQRYSGDFSVVSACVCGEYYILACGQDGIHVVDKDFNLITKVKRESFCCDVKTAENYIVGAFSEEGICVYELRENLLVYISKYKDTKSIQQLMLSESKKYLACCLGSTDVIMLDISDKFNLKKIFSRKAQKGPLYGENFASKNLNDGTMLMFWHRDGLVFSNPDKGDREFKNTFYEKRSGFMYFGPESGFDTDGEDLFYTLDNGYVFLPTETTDVDNLRRYMAEESICGKIAVCDNKIISIERAKGIITVTDISDKKRPETIGKINTDATCYKPLCIENRTLIPARYDGLLELEISNKK